MFYFYFWLLFVVPYCIIVWAWFFTDKFVEWIFDVDGFDMTATCTISAIPKTTAEKLVDGEWIEVELERKDGQIFIPKGTFRNLRIDDFKII
jgi:hypothetical protein